MVAAVELQAKGPKNIATRELLQAAKGQEKLMAAVELQAMGPKNITAKELN